MKGVSVVFIGITLLPGFACKEAYKPTIFSSPNSYLVVEGVLNSGLSPATIRLSRSFKLDDTAQLRGELNAQVVVEGKDNTARQMTMTGDGIYTSAHLNLINNAEYRLRITTSNGKQYLSDYVIARQTPPIDSLGFRQEEDGVLLYANTHDDSNNTRYYHWEYGETWEIRSYYYSLYKYVNDKVIDRTPADDVSVCWKYNSSKSILVGSTASLESDIVYRAPISFFLNGDEKLAVRYSILVRQYALDKRGYEFYDLMKKNTESLGTIFDAQPSEMRGNIHCISDPDEIVIGYVSASSVEEKRFFISNSQLDRWRFYEDCPMNQIPNHPDSIRQAYQNGQSIITSFYPQVGNDIAGYYVSYAPCVECPKRGGSVMRPSYW